MSRILIDVDGVVADTHADLLERVGSKLKAEDVKEWDLFKTFKGKEKNRAESIMNDPSFWANLPVKDGAKKAIRLLKAHGHDIVWVTSPWRSCFGWESSRRFFLSEHFGDDPIVVTHDKYLVDGDVFIDDKVANVEQWKKTHPGKKAFIYDAPYNRDYTGAPRFDWSKVEKLL